MQFQGEIKLDPKWNSIRNKILIEIKKTADESMELLFNTLDEKIHYQEMDESKQLLTVFIELCQNKEMDACVALLKPFQVALFSSEVTASFPITSDVLLNKVVPSLSLRDLQSFASTCLFFSKDLGIKRRIRELENKVHFALGSAHTLILLPNGSLFGFGWNGYGQLGLGHTRDQNIPQPIRIPEGIMPCKIATNGEHSLVLCEEDAIYAFGHNEYGQLGLGHTNNQNTPQLVSMPEGKKPYQIAAGVRHSLILCEGDELYACGSNLFGQLGLGHTNSQNTPQLVSMPEGKKPYQIAAGAHHSLILCEEGELYAFGANQFGQLGLGHTNNQNTPQLVNMPENVKPCQIATHLYHNLILCEGGLVYAFGDNRNNQLGYMLKEKQMVPELVIMPDKKVPCQLAVGGQHSVILCEGGSIYTVGQRDKGQLGQGKENGSLTRPLPSTSIPIRNKPCQIAAGNNHNLVLCANGLFYAFGDNSCGQLGLMPSEALFHPIARSIKKEFAEALNHEQEPKPGL